MIKRRIASPSMRALVASCAVAAAGTAPASADNGALGVAYPAGEIRVDGDLGDWPAEAKTYPIERVEAGDKPGSAADLKARFRLAYKPGERALYVAVEVDDDSIVLDPPGEGEPKWDAQDGCELFVDAAHVGGGSPVFQYARYGGKDRVVGPLEVPEKSVQVAVKRADGRIAYEWRIEVAADLAPDRAIGFDVAVADKDADGSFSWAAWGPGTQKADSSDRCGAFLLVAPETRFGEAAGSVAWEPPSEAPLPAKVRVRSARVPQLWREADVDASGNFRVTMLPAGEYEALAVDTPDVRVAAGPGATVRVEADRTATAGPLRAAPLPWPGLVGDEGLLRSAGPVDADAIDRVAKAYVDYFKIPGMSLAVIKDSRVVYSKGFGVKDAVSGGAVGADTVFEAASMTKPTFAYTVLRLVDRGLLELDEPLYTYLPYEDIAHDERYKLITARMVLTHRTGFPNWRNGKLDIKFTPGEQVLYSGEGFVYLGKVVEKLVGKPVAEVIREEAFVPLGIEHASLVWDDEVARLAATGHGTTSPLKKWKPTEANTAASLHVDAGNYAKFLIAVLKGDGLSPALAKEMLRVQVAVPDRKGASWGLGISIEETPVGVNYGHGGRNVGFTSHSVLYPGLGGIGYVFLVNNDDASKMDDVLNAFLIAGKSALRGGKAILHKPARVDPKVYDAYVGKYQLNPAVVVDVTREGDRLMAQGTDSGKVEIFPASESVFFLKPTRDVTFRFVKDDHGKVTHLVMLEGGGEAMARRIDGSPKPDAAK